ncbi:MAG TPA: hypothetical protein VFX30_07105 [bacterium]|nr:hypothetical protein [bacterium]
MIPADDPVLDGIEARFAMSEAGLSQIMRFAGTAPAQTGHDIMGLLASLMAHREESPHVETPPPAQTDPNADARTASMVAASIGAITSAVGSIAAGAGSSGGAVPNPDTGTGEAAPVETAPTAETAPTETSTDTSTSTSSESPPPVETASEEAPPPPVAETAPVVAAEDPPRPRWRDRDGDHDGVPNGRDRCRDTPAGAEVDEHGCSPDPVPEAEPEPEGEDNEEAPPPGESYTGRTPEVPAVVMPCDPDISTCSESDGPPIRLVFEPTVDEDAPLVLTAREPGAFVLDPSSVGSTGLVFPFRR